MGGIYRSALEIDKVGRAALLRQRPQCLWFTGLSASGKSTIANLLDKELFRRRRHSYRIDGDNLRGGLCQDLSFSDSDRIENVRRAAEVAKLFVDAGVIVLVSMISPFRSQRSFARSLFEPGEFREIFVHASLEVCERRDPNGLYRRARSGEITNMTGIDSVYEAPTNPDIILDTMLLTPRQCVEKVIEAFPTFSRGSAEVYLK